VRPLWREVGSVLCQYKVWSLKSLSIYTVLHEIVLYTIYKTSVNPGPVQQIMPDYEQCRLLGFKNPVRTSQETHYVYSTDYCQLILFKIWSFHVCDYEECRLLGFKKPIPSSQETYYVYSTDSCQLILCKIWGFHGGGYERFRLLGCYIMWLL
jgi:hypothetical protein